MGPAATQRRTATGAARKAAGRGASRGAGPPPARGGRSPGSRRPAGRSTPQGRGPARSLRSLVERPRADGPHGRLGVLWALFTFPVVVAGVAPLALWLALVTAAAAGQTSRSWRTKPFRPVPLVAVVSAGAVVGCAAAGLYGVALSLVLATGAAYASPRVPGLVGGRSSRARPDPGRTLLVATACGLAGASLVIARGMGVSEGIALFALVSSHDLAVYVVGTGANRLWEGIVAAWAAIAAVSLALAALFVPPFRGSSPWVLAGVVALTAPLGPLVASALLGDRSARVPVLRRLDSLIVAGPAWVVAARLLLDG